MEWTNEEGELQHDEELLEEKQSPERVWLKEDGAEVMLEFTDRKIDKPAQKEGHLEQLPNSMNQEAPDTTTGYRFEEQYIGRGQKLYVLAEASDRSGELKIGVPLKEANNFLLSTLSEEALVSNAKESAVIFKYMAWILSPAGAGLAGYGLYLLYFAP